MARKHYTVEQIMKKLREAEVEAGRGTAVADVCGRMGMGSPSTGSSGTSF